MLPNIARTRTSCWIFHFSSTLLHQSTHSKLRPLITPRCYATKVTAEELGIVFPVEEEEVPGYQKENFYPATLGEVLNHQYKIIVKLGFGRHSTVWLGKREKRSECP
jgi:hypothetical protein